MPEALQAHLLRLLDGGEYQRLGETRRRTADLRVVAATNRPPEELKYDIAARLSLRLHVPSLDDRRGDIPMLLRHVVQRLALREESLAESLLDDAGRPRLSLRFVRSALEGSLPTNVRQLQGQVWDALLATPEGRPLAPPDAATPNPKPSVRVDRPSKEEVSQASSARVAYRRGRGGPWVSPTGTRCGTSFVSTTSKGLGRYSHSPSCEPHHGTRTAPPWPAAHTPSAVPMTRVAVPGISQRCPPRRRPRSPMAPTQRSPRTATSSSPPGVSPSRLSAPKTCQPRPGCGPRPRLR